MLDRGADAGVGLRCRSGHRIEQPAHLWWEEERPDSPATRPAPLAQTRTDDGPLRIEARQRHVRSLVVDLAVDFVTDDDQLVLARDAGDVVELGRVKAEACRV